jgi:Ca2+-binding EF-hand superfamily protein
MKIKRVLLGVIGAVLMFSMAWNLANLSAQTTGHQRLTVMDPDHDGTVSKEEFRAYMDAQFDKADMDHDGTLDAKELAQLRKNLAIATTRR